MASDVSPATASSPCRVVNEMGPKLICELDSCIYSCLPNTANAKGTAVKHYGHRLQPDDRTVGGTNYEKRNPDFGAIKALIIPFNLSSQVSEIIANVDKFFSK